MAYYMRSNNASSHGNYMISNSSMQGGYLMHSAKGSEWKKPHKYLDKRWIDGAWKYLYELPKNVQETAKNVGENIQKRHNYAVNEMKKTAKNVGENIQKRHNYAVNEMKKTAEKAVDTVKDLKDYSKKVDERRVRANEEREQRDSSEERNRLHNKIASAVEEREKAEKELQDFDERWKRGEVVNQQEIHDAKKRAEDAKKREENARNALERAEEVREKDERTAFETSVEMQSAKYKASEALNKIDNLIDDASGSAKQGLQWLKNQLESGNKWAMNTLADIEEKGSSALATGSAFLKNLLGKEKPKENSNTASRSINISNSSSASGRKYSGVGQKAEVKDKKEIHAAEVARNNAEAEVTYARKTYGFNSEEYKRAVSKFQRKNEEYLNLSNGGPVSNNKYNGRPSKRK